VAAASYSIRTEDSIYARRTRAYRIRVKSRRLRAYFATHNLPAWRSMVTIGVESREQDFVTGVVMENNGHRRRVFLLRHFFVTVVILPASSIAPFCAMLVTEGDAEQ